MLHASQDYTGIIERTAGVTVLLNLKIRINKNQSIFFVFINESIKNSCLDFYLSYSLTRVVRVANYIYWFTVMQQTSPNHSLIRNPKPNIFIFRHSFNRIE